MARLGGGTGLVAIAVVLALLLVTVPSSSSHRVPASFGISLTETPDHGPAPLLVQFDASVFPGAHRAQFDWTFGDGARFTENASGLSTPAHVYTQPGTYMATVSARSVDGATNASVAIRVATGNLSASIIALPAKGQVPLTVEFSAAVSGGSGTYTSVLWNFGDGGNGSGFRINYTYLTSGVFVVALNVTGPGGEHANAGSTIEALSHAAALPTSDGGYHPLLPGAVAGLVATTLGLIGIAYWFRARRPPEREATAAQPSPPSPLQANAPADEPTSGRPSLDLSPSPSFSGDAFPSPIVPGSSVRPPLPVPSSTIKQPLGGVVEDPLRLSERLLVHLYWFRYGELSGLGRMEATQQGMVRALGISQNTASKILSRLVAAGAIRTETLHVPGASRRVKVYALTPTGDSLARQLGAPRWRPDATFQRVEWYSDPGS